MKKHRIEKAIVLGLILSTSIYGTSFAAEEVQQVTTKEFQDGKLASGEAIDGVTIDNNTYTVNKDIIVNGTVLNGAEQWWVNSKKVDVKENINLVFNDVSLRSAIITGNGNITVNENKSGIPIFVGGDIQANNLTLNTNSGNGIYAYGHNVNLDVNNLTINSTTNGIIQEANDNTPLTNIYIDDTQSVNIHSSSSWAIHSNGRENIANSIYIRSDRENSIINAMGANGVSNTSVGETILKADDINIGAWSYYGAIAGSGKLDILAKNNITIADDVFSEERKGTYAGQAVQADSGTVTINAENGDTTIIGREGVFTNRKSTEGKVNITSGNTNRIFAGTHTLQAAGGDITVIGKENYITADSDVLNQKFNPDFGNGLAIAPEGTSTTTLTATEGNNIIKGAVSVEKGASLVNITGKTNEISSSHIIAEEERPDNTDPENSKIDTIISAVYTNSGGTVDIKGNENEIRTSATDEQKERVIWAQDGTVNISGLTNIIAQNGNSGNPNQVGVALAAGASYDDTEQTTRAADKGVINANLASGSYIQGDILAGIDGIVNLNNEKPVQNITVRGNILAANRGINNVNLGDNSTWTGRADSYMDASVDNEHGTDYFAPQFSRKIKSAGDVNVTLGKNSTWNVNGQSWVTTLNTAPTTTIDLVAANNDFNTDAQALTIENLNGGGTFKMDLDGTRSQSDMLYIKNGSGSYDVLVNDVVTTDDMYADNHTGLRFATVGKNANVKFANVMTKDAGAFDVKYRVETDEYANNRENAAYDGAKMNEKKPGSSAVENLFTETGAVETQSLARAAEPETQADTATAEATNHKIVAIEEYIPNGNEDGRPNDGNSGTKLSDAGRTILNMAKANYNQAVHMDTLNKRMGEARYLDKDEEGLWVRMRHDKTDKDTGFEISTNMYELGYDKKYESKDGNGYHRRGVALDYMDGDTSYDDIAGSGETNRKGIWVYDTWFGNKGHYTDYIAKWGHLENSFDLYTKTRGEKVSGEYDNDVYSISAEWGYKNILNEDKENPENNKDKWYIEPQLQMQYARVTGADYTTSQGTDVSVDGIDSLIARAGFRLGKDFGDDRKSTFYVKADVLHEFLGDQDITVKDKTTDNKFVGLSYDNDGTWYTVGLGFSTMLSDHSYAFLDVEKLFGNDNDNSYQINGGVQWAL